MKQRPRGFLGHKNVPRDSEVFDYIVELHQYLWRVVNVAIPGASGSLASYLPQAIEILENRTGDDVSSTPVPSEERA